MENADLSGVFGKLLENPDALKSAVEIASKLKSSGALDGIMGDGGGAYGGQTQSYNEEKSAQGEQASASKTQATTTGSLRGVPKNGERAQRTQLLSALRPYMSPARQEKIDTALKVLKLVDLAEQLGVFGMNG